MKRYRRAILIFIAQTVGLYAVCYTLFYAGLLGAEKMGERRTTDVWCTTPNPAYFSVKVVDQQLTPIPNPTANIHVESPNCSEWSFEPYSHLTTPEGVIWMQIDTDSRGSNVEIEISAQHCEPHRYNYEDVSWLVSPDYIVTPTQQYTYILICATP